MAKRRRKSEGGFLAPDGSVHASKRARRAYLWYMAKIRHRKSNPRHRRRGKNPTLYYLWVYSGVSNYLIHSSAHNTVAQAESVAKRYRGKGYRIDITQYRYGRNPRWRRVMGPYGPARAKFTKDGRLINIKYGTRRRVKRNTRRRR